VGILKNLFITAIVVILIGVAIDQHLQLQDALALANLRGSIIQTMIVQVKRIPLEVMRK